MQQSNVSNESSTKAIDDANIETADKASDHSNEIGTDRNDEIDDIDEPKSSTDDIDHDKDNDHEHDDSDQDDLNNDDLNHGYPPTETNSLNDGAPPTSKSRRRHDPQFNDLSSSRQFFFPLSRIKKITTFDPTTKGLTSEAKLCMALACERFVEMMGNFVAHETRARGKRNIKLHDVSDAIRCNPQLEFLQFGMRKMMVEALRQQAKEKEFASQRAAELAKRRKDQKLQKQQQSNTLDGNIQNHKHQSQKESNDKNILSAKNDMNPPNISTMNTNYSIDAMFKRQSDANEIQID